MPRINVKDKRKQQLIEANVASIAKRGIAETTIAHVSKGAGMSRGIVNFYFTTKETMMQETCQALAEEYQAVWERALEKLGDKASSLQKLHALVAAQFSSTLCNQKKLAVWVAFWGHASSQGDYQKIVASADNALTAKITEIYRQTGGKEENFADVLYAMIRGLWLKFLLASTNTSRETLAAQCQAFLVNALENRMLEADNVTDMDTKKMQTTRKNIKTPKAANLIDDLFAMGG